MKVIFFGSSRYAVPVLEMLYNNFDLTQVVTTEQNSMDPIPFFCKSKKMDFLPVRKSADLISKYEIENSQSELAVVADFGLIIPERLFKIFPFGFINIHPSLLPLYRGPTPAQSAILNGETKTGVTIIQLDKYVDHGPILGQVEEKIKPSDTAKSLYERLFRIGTTLLEKIIIKYDSGGAISKPQNHENATFTKTLSKEDGYVDFAHFFTGKDFFERMVRAYYPWPGVWTKVNLTEDKKDEKVVKFLPDKKIQVEGGREMQYKDFINGYPKANKNLMELLRKDI